ncbi:hypothetical protein AVEN_161159-1 [Araneus ventricosus]|uniref:Uncharacterized protein n=1 Tax=Araneus ventricosus TaxID=182803 RepID=A0A4Y2TV36_ARAVE|nr:hypothetical protein AVEN_161159-1 [Araneus ventricosus]
MRIGCFQYASKTRRPKCLLPYKISPPELVFGKLSSFRSIPSLHRHLRMCMELNKGGFSNQTDDSDSDDEDAILADLKEKWKTVEGNGRITNVATFSDILEVDAKLLTASYPTDEEILKSLMGNNKGQENDSYSKNEDVIQAKPHRTEILQSFETIKRGFQMEENVPDYF